MIPGETPLDRFKRWYRLLPPAMRLLLTVNVALYVAWLVLRLSGPASAFIIEYIALRPADVLTRPWQLVTYNFLHLQLGFWGLIHVAFNMLWLYWMGREYEETYGSNRLFGLFMMAGVFGGLLAVLAQPVLPDVLARGLYAGSTAGVFGVLCGVAALHPDRGIGLFIIGVVKLKWIAIVFVGLSALFNPDVTHLGGAFFGVMFALAQKRDVDLAAWARPFFPNRNYGSLYYGSSRGSDREEREGFFGRVGAMIPGREKHAAETAVARRTGARRAEAASPAGEEKDVDRILDKILDQGMDSLSAEERRILENASRK
jgi:membrane associated rhomboid family serine protease